MLHALPLPSLPRAARISSAVRIKPPSMRSITVLSNDLRKEASPADTNTMPPSVSLRNVPTWGKYVLAQRCTCRKILADYLDVIPLRTWKNNRSCALPARGSEMGSGDSLSPKRHGIKLQRRKKEHGNRPRGPVPMLLCMGHIMHIY